MKFSSIFFQKNKSVQAATLALVMMLCALSASGLILSMPESAEAQALRSTRLDAQLTEAKSRIVSGTMIESTFKAKIRAYGGDIYLPAYTEDVIWRPAYPSPLQMSNAVIPGTATVRIDPEDAKKLSTENGRYILREYEEIGISIVTTSKIIPDAITSPRLIFKTELSSLIWRPVVQEKNEDEVGNPFLDVSPLGWETNSVIFFNPKSSPDAPSSDSEAVESPAASIAPTEAGARPAAMRKRAGLASVFGIFNQLESQLRGLFLK